MRRQLEELRHLWPLVCAIIGICLIESNLALIPWKALGLLSAFIAAISVVAPIMTKEDTA